MKKLDEHYKHIKETSGADHPVVIKQLFIYQDQMYNEYLDESHELIDKYKKEIMEPMREVGRIELKGNRQKRKLVITEAGSKI